jgi:hypothetical protein
MALGHMSKVALGMMRVDGTNRRAGRQIMPPNAGLC